MVSHVKAACGIFRKICLVSAVHDDVYRWILHDIVVVMVLWLPRFQETFEQQLSSRIQEESTPTARL